MEMEHLVALEVSRKQHYIFRSNRLSENIGASSIISRVTGELALALAMAPRHKGKVGFIGGGRSIFRFDSKENALGFSKEITRESLSDYPGLELFTCLLTYDVDSVSAFAAVERLFTALNRKKGARRGQARQIDFGVARVCPSTQGPCAGRYEDEWLSAESISKREVERKVHEAHPEEIRSFDHLGRSKDEKSYLAVVHIDGNRLGARVRDVLGRFRESTGRTACDSYFENAQLFSEGIDKVFEDAYERTKRVIEQNLVLLQEELSLDSKLNRGRIPIRLIVRAGDDVCFVTDGRIGLEASAIFLSSLETAYTALDDNTKQRIGGIPVRACAGVALVKAHFPFSMAYEVAESLCQSAKKQVRKTASKSQDHTDQSAMDWMVVQGEPGDAEDLDSDYHAEDGTLLRMRPVILEEDAHALNYDGFRTILKHLQEGIKSEDLARGKLKSLKDQLKKGQAASDLFVRFNDLSTYIPCIQEGRLVPFRRRSSGEIQTAMMGGRNEREERGGYISDTDGKARSLLFDAIELLDLFIPLERR